MEKKKYHVTWFNYLGNSDEIIPITASNKGEALKTALLHLINSGRKYATYDDVSNIYEVDEDYYYSLEKEMNVYKAKHNDEEPDIRNVVYNEDADDWFIKQSDGTLTYLDGGIYNNK